MSDDYELTDLDDAIIEDTCHCQCCSATFVLGGNDYVLVEVPQINNCIATLALCIECAKHVHKEYRTSLVDAGVCEHGENLDRDCPECSAATNLLKEIVRFWGSTEVWGDFSSLTRAAGAFAPIADRARKILAGE